MGNPLPRLKEILDFEQFRPILEPVVAKESRKSNAGRRGMDPVFMTRVLFLQRLYGLGDKQIEYQIKDRMSFREFLDIESVDDVPDEKTVWKYKDVLAKANIAMTNLVYNMCRLAQIIKYHPEWIVA